MLFGVDYSAGRPSIEALRGAGVKFVCRYVGALRREFNLTADEADQLHKAGYPIVLVFEQETHQCLNGRPQGIRDANAALVAAREAGVSGPQPIYFAVDFDTQDYAPALPNTQPNARAKLGPIAEYFAGVQTVLSTQNTGVYGGYWVVKRLLDAGLCRYAWQTYAWSGGNWEARAQLRQYSNGHDLGGVSVDYNRAMVSDFGQWLPQPKPKPVPPPKPSPVPPVPPAPTPDPAPPIAVTIRNEIVREADSLRGRSGFAAWSSWREGSGSWKHWGPQNRLVRPSVAPRIPVSWWRKLRLFHV